MNTLRIYPMLSADDADDHVRRLTSRVPDVPVLIENSSALVATDDPVVIMGLPVAWFAVLEGRHSVIVNRLHVGLHIAMSGTDDQVRDLGKSTRDLARSVRKALMTRLESVDAGEADITVLEPAPATPREVTARLDALNAAARRLNTTPRALVARILGRTLH